MGVLLLDRVSPTQSYTSKIVSCTLSVMSFYWRNNKCLSFETMQCTSVISCGKCRLPDSILKCEPVCLLPKPHTHKHMYVSSNYLVKLIIPISLPPSFIRKEGDSGPTTVTLSPVSTSTDASLSTETTKLDKGLPGLSDFRS